MRIGIGYDVHQLVEERKLMIGGVEIPYEKGLLGHSDADVLIHAVMDAILGALGLGDIGKHFPDSDERYRGASSVKLLEHVASLMSEEGYLIGNIDAVVIAQRPKLGGYFDEMKHIMSKAIGCELSSLNLKATTTEHLGFEGRGEGIASEAVVLLIKK